MVKMYGLKWNGFFCPSCRKKSIVHCLANSSDIEKGQNENGEKFPEHLREKLDVDRSQYCMACGWWGIISDF